MYGQPQGSSKQLLLELYETGFWELCMGMVSFYIGLEGMDGAASVFSYNYRLSS